MHKRRGGIPPTARASARKDHWYQPTPPGVDPPSVITNRLAPPGTRTVAQLGAGLLMGAVLVGCSVSPGPGLQFGSKSGSAASPSGPTSLVLETAWRAAGRVGAPTATSCSDGGSRVTVRGAFGPETVTIRISGVHPGSRYIFVAYARPITARVTLTETGPIPKTVVLPGGGTEDSNAPVHGQQPGGSNGTLSVAGNGRSGELNLTLPAGDSIKGHWSCGSRAAHGPPSRPALLPATSAPVIDECWKGPQNGTPPPPARCANGDLNIAAWIPHSKVEAAGPAATLTQVETDLCQDRASGIPKAYVLSVYASAYAYYGWGFTDTAEQALAQAACGGGS